MKHFRLLKKPPVCYWADILSGRCACAPNRFVCECIYMIYLHYRTIWGDLNYWFLNCRNAVCEALTIVVSPLPSTFYCLSGFFGFLHIIPVRHITRWVQNLPSATDSAHTGLRCDGFKDILCNLVSRAVSLVPSKKSSISNSWDVV